MTSLPADYFRPGDAPLLAAFCVASVFHRRAATDIELRGIALLDSKGREYCNPSHQMLTSQSSSRCSQRRGGGGQRAASA